MFEARNRTKTEEGETNKDSVPWHRSKTFYNWLTVEKGLHNCTHKHTLSSQCDSEAAQNDKALIQLIKLAITLDSRDNGLVFHELDRAMADAARQWHQSRRQTMDDDDDDDNDVDHESWCGKMIHSLSLLYLNSLLSYNQCLFFLILQPNILFAMIYLIFHRKINSPAHHGTCFSLCSLFHTITVPLE